MPDLPATYEQRGVWAGFKTANMNFGRLRLDNGSSNPKDWMVLIPGFSGKKEASIVLPLTQVKSAFGNLAEDDIEFVDDIVQAPVSPLKPLISPADIRASLLKRIPRFGQSLSQRRRDDHPEEAEIDRTVEAQTYLRLVVQLMRLTGEAYGQAQLKKMTVNTYRLLMNASKSDAETAAMQNKFNKIMFEHLASTIDCSVEEAMARLEKFAIAIAPAVQVDSADDSLQGWLIRQRNRLGTVLSDLEDRQDELPELFKTVLGDLIFPFQQFLGIAAKELSRVERRANNLQSSLKRLDKALAECEEAKLNAALALDGWQPICSLFEAALAAEQDEDIFKAIDLALKNTPLVPREVVEDLENELTNWRDFSSRQRKLVEALEDWRTGKIDQEMASRM